MSRTTSQARRALSIWFATAPLLAASAASAQLAGDYTIGGADPDFASFGVAVAALESEGVSGAVTFHVRAGNYSEAGGSETVLTLGPVAGASAANRVTFRPDTASGAGVDDVVLERSSGTPASGGGYVALLTSDYVTLRELTFRNTDASSSSYTHFNFVTIGGTGGESNGLEIVGCVFEPRGLSRHVLSVTVAFTAFRDLRITDNRFDDFPAGISLLEHGNSTFADVTIEGNHFTGMRYASGSGGGTPPSVPIFVSGFSQRLVIRRNVLDYQTAAGQSGIVVSGLALDFVIDGNQIRNVVQGGNANLFNGIDVNDAASRGRIVNNAVSIFTPRRRGILVGSSGGILVAHNTVYLPARAIDLFGGSTALTTCASNLTVVGNLFVELGTDANVYAISHGCDGTDNVFDGNLLYSSGALARDGKFNVWSLDVWRARGFGAASVSKLPEIVDGQNDLHIAGCSAADPELRTLPIDDPAVAFDIDGDARSPLAAVMGADQPLPETLVQPFEAAVAIPFGAGPTQDRALDVAAADLDGDGDIDLVLAVHNEFESAGAVELLENLGGGVFAPAQPLPSLLQPARILVRIGDIDGDGALDVVSTAASTSSLLPRLRVSWGVGDGSFLPDVPIQIPGGLTPTQSYLPYIVDLEVGDLDGDGVDDIVVIQGSDLSPDGVTTLCRTPTDPRVFQDVTRPNQPSVIGDVVLGDLDGDGDLDAVTEGLLFENVFGACVLDPKGSLPAPDFDTGPLNPALVIADVDGDGIGDVVGDAQDSPFGSDIVLLRSNGDSTFESFERILVEANDERRPGPLTALDYDGDGDVDLFVGNRFPSGPTNLVPGTGVLMQNDGSGAFSRVLACGQSTIPSQPRKVIAADLDGDGLDDIVAITWNHTEEVWWLRNAADGFDPVVIEDFLASVDAPSVDLSWATPSEALNAGFEVQRRVDPSAPWQRIGVVPGAGTTPEPQQYALTDPAPPTGAVGYRLLQVDITGAVRTGPDLVVQVPEPAGAWAAALAGLAALAAARSRRAARTPS